MAAKIPVGPLKLSIQPGNGSFQDAPTMDGRTAMTVRSTWNEKGVKSLKGIFRSLTHFIICHNQMFSVKTLQER